MEIPRGGKIQERIVFWLLCCMAVFGVLLSLGLVSLVVIRGWAPLMGDMAQGLQNTSPGILLPLFGTLFMTTGSVLLVLPLGLGMGLYLKEYANFNPLAGHMERVVGNLADVPPIVYGLVGWAMVARSLLAPGWPVVFITIGLWMLPKTAALTVQALNQVPMAHRRDSLALGASPWQTSAHAVLPFAFRQIASDVLKAMARLAGEASPLIMLMGAMPNYTVVSPEPLALHVYYSLIDHVQARQSIPYGAALLLLILALSVQAAGEAIDPRRGQDVGYLGNRIGKG